MQRLQSASNDSQACARAVLDSIPGVFQFIRYTANRHRSRGLAVQQFRALAYLHRRPGDSLSLLADYLGLSLAATSRLINCLVEKKLVRRAAVPSNRRKVHLTLTARGKKSFGETGRWTEAELTERLKQLSPQRRENIIEAVGDLHRVFQF
jgi:DNA-binding MarR family transcriptional regulator